MQGESLLWRLRMHSEQTRAKLPDTSCCHVTLTLAVLLTIAGGCQRPNTPPAQAEPTAPKVTIAKPEKKTIRREVAQPGHVEAFERTPIMARIPGYVLK